MKNVTKFKKLELGFSVWCLNHYTVRTKMGVAFISYASIVAFKDYDTQKVTLGADYEYSRITMRRVCQWLGAENIAEVRKGIKDGTYLYDKDL